MKHWKSVALCVAILAILFPSASLWAVWEGNAGIAAGSRFPGTGMYALSDMFPKNTIVDIQNLETEITIRAVITGPSGVPGLVAVLSPEVASALNINAGSVSRVRISVPSPVAERPASGMLFPTDAVANADPDLNPEKAVNKVDEPVTMESITSKAENPLVPVPSEKAESAASAASEPPAATPTTASAATVDTPTPEAPVETVPAGDLPTAIEPTVALAPDSERATNAEPVATPEAAATPVLTPEAPTVIAESETAPAQDATTAAYTEPDATLPPETVDSVNAPSAEESGVAAVEPEVPQNGPAIDETTPTEAEIEPSAELALVEPLPVTPEETPATPTDNAPPAEATQPTPVEPVSVTEVALVPAEANPPAVVPVFPPTDIAVVPEINLPPVVTPVDPALSRPVSEVAETVAKAENPPPALSPADVPVVESIKLAPKFAVVPDPVARPVPTVPPVSSASAAKKEPEPKPSSRVSTPEPVAPARKPALDDTPKAGSKAEAKDVPVATAKPVAVTEVSPIPQMSSPEPATVAQDLPYLTSVAKGSYYIQIASYSDVAKVRKILDAWSGKYPISVERSTSKKGEVLKVLVGPVKTDEYGAILEKFKKLGYSDAFVRKGK